MAKTLFARGSDGLVSIHNEGADVNNPLDNLQNFYFHSALDYLYILQTITLTVSLPGTLGAFGSLIYVGTHGLGRNAMAMGYRTDTGENLMGSTLIDYDGAGGFRRVTLCADATNVYLHFAGGGGSAYAASSIPLRVYVFGNQTL